VVVIKAQRLSIRDTLKHSEKGAILDMRPYEMNIADAYYTAFIQRTASNYCVT